MNLFVLLGAAALCTLVSGWATRQQRKVADVWVGMLFGVIAVVVMLVPVVTRSGMLVDARAGVVGTAAFLGGPAVAAACLPLPVAYRVVVGGAGLVPGVLELLLAAALGVAGNLLVRRCPQRLTLGQVVLFSVGLGVLTEGLSGAWIWLAAPETTRAAMSGTEVAAAFLLAPASMTLLTTLIVLEQRHFRVVDAYADAERRMLHSQRLAAVGQLSHKVAHSFLNGLAVILGAAERAKQEASANAQVAEAMECVIGTVERLSIQAGELVAFSVPSTMRRRRMELSRCLMGLDRLLSNVLGSEVELVVDGRQDAGVVHVDPARIEQIIVHMAINAVDAMGGQGRLTISAGTARLSAGERARLQGHLPERSRHDGPFAVLRVQDTGAGMPQSVAARVFEPFFTTKRNPENAGLGLASVLSIVQMHSGLIDVQSRPGEGTTFLVYFPVVA